MGTDGEYFSSIQKNYVTLFYRENNLSGAQGGGETMKQFPRLRETISDKPTTQRTSRRAVVVHVTCRDNSLVPRTCSSAEFEPPSKGALTTR